jgi:hypothetical protein
MPSPLARRFAALTLATAVTAALVTATGPAQADGSTPPWEPDPSAVGTITLYDASGNVITDGSTNTAPFAAYAVASDTLRAGDVQATVKAANPDPNSAPTSWFVDSPGGFTAYPVATGPANIQALSATHPVATGKATDLTLDDFYGEITHFTATGYTNVVQLRMFSANSLGNQSTAYATADLLLDPAAHTFTVEYPAAATLPDAPTNVSASAVNAKATVTWTAPSGSVDGYDVQYSSNNGATWTSASSSFHTNPAATETVTGLTNGTAYKFRAAAINAAGTGPYSTPSAAVTPTADRSSLSIKATSPVKYGGKTTVSATLTDSVTHNPIKSASLGLYERASSHKPFAKVKTVTTSSTGKASTSITLKANEQFEWKYTGSATHKAVTSKVAPVTVSQVVNAARTPATVKHGDQVKIYGTVSPTGHGTVTVQELVGHKWKSLGTATIKKQTLPNHRKQTGFVFATRPANKGHYSYRVYRPATSTIGAGYSATLKVTAT